MESTYSYVRNKIYEKGMTLTEFSELTGLSRYTINKLGQKRARDRTLFKIAEGLGDLKLAITIKQLEDYELAQRKKGKEV